MIPLSSGVAALAALSHGPISLPLGSRRILIVLVSGPIDNVVRSLELASVMVLALIVNWTEVNRVHEFACKCKGIKRL